MMGLITEEELDKMVKDTLVETKHDCIYDFPRVEYEDETNETNQEKR
jgi:hypothetical protein